MSNHIVTLPAAAWPPLEFYHINCIWTVSCDHAVPIGVLVFQDLVDLTLKMKLNGEVLACAV